MTLVTTALKPVVAALLAALALGASTAHAGGGPTITAGPGCSVQCITKALVTVTSTSAKVELATTVPAHLLVSVAKQTHGGTTGGLTASLTKSVSVSAFSPLKTAFFLGLEPDTTYAITVRATDLSGRRTYRKGTFATLPVKTSGHAAGNGLDSGLGCSAQCIQKALFTQKPPAASIADVDLRVAVDAQIQVVVSRDKPAQTPNGPAQFDVVSSQQSPGFVRSWQTQVGGLAPGTVYHVVVRAKDRQGRMSVRQGTFKTVPAHAVVTIHRIKVLNDGDKGRNKGELYFRLWVGDDVLARWGSGWTKLGSGSVLTVRHDSTRPGFIFSVPANGDGAFEMKMLGEECDAVLKKNCIIEAWGQSGGQYAIAGGSFHVSELLKAGALPPWYGTGVTPPAGHDGYVVFGTTDAYVKFLVLATIDLEIDWP
jgi:hypothetical protein